MNEFDVSRNLAKRVQPKKNVPATFGHYLDNYYEDYNSLRSRGGGPLYHIMNGESAFIKRFLDQYKLLHHIDIRDANDIPNLILGHVQKWYGKKSLDEIQSILGVDKSIGAFFNSFFQSRYI